MMRVYWRPRRVSTNVMLLIASLALASATVVEFFPERTSEEYVRQMLQASRLAHTAMEAIRAERNRRGIPIDPIADPAGTGLIGLPMSEVTSNRGNLLAKQTSVNPNWAAVAVRLLREANVREGDTVAVGLSGSFPGINIAIYAAMATLQVDPIIISSLSASQWGANHPKLLWIEMEKVLQRRKVFPFRSVAVSLGGAEDRAVGVSSDGLRTLKSVARRSSLRFIYPDNYAESVIQRVAIYEEQAKGRRIAAYINVGGATSSVGTHRSKYAFNPGVNWRTPFKAELVDSVMARFLDQGTPVIHFLQIERMARRYGLPLQPRTTPPVGSGRIFLERRYNPWLASGALVVLVTVLFLFLRSGRGQMALQSARADRRAMGPTL